MNKTAIKNYAVWARNELIERVTRKAYEYGVKNDDIVADNCAEMINGRLLTEEEKAQRKQLIDEINKKGFDQVIEEVSYTWFNRFIALRFMEVNNYIPQKVRVFTNSENEFKPELLDEAIHLDIEGIDKEKVFELIDTNQRDELYKMLLLAICNDMGNYLPGMFTTIADYTMLLFPDNLLKEDSVLGKLISDIEADNFDIEKEGQVEIIGWFYQFYNIEPKDKVFSRKSGTKIRKEDIPAATQLFTPDWIVRYMVENSLGRFWLEGYPNDQLKENWKYYLDEAAQEPEVESKLEDIRNQYKSYKPEDIKVIDTCMGSGHIIIYAFDVFMQIYESYGYTKRDAAQLIIENNLYGIDLDERAYQLSYFAIMMKARQYSRRILSKNIKPNVYYVASSKEVHENIWEYFGEQKEVAMKLWQSFENASELGSLLELDITLDELNSLEDKLEEIRNQTDSNDLLAQAYTSEAYNAIAPLMKVAKVLVLKYEVVVTNPPYLPVSNCETTLQKFIKKNYPDSKTDLFAVFMEKCKAMLIRNGLQAMINMHSWMFLSSYEKLREKLLSTTTIVNMAHLGARAFEEIGGEVVQTTAFVLRNGTEHSYVSSFKRLVDFAGQDVKRDAYLTDGSLYQVKCDNFEKIPGSPIAYWASENIFNCFSNDIIDSKVLFRQGMATSDNNRFLRLWYEVSQENSNYHSNNLNDAIESNKKWFAYNKGGSYRKWYGNIEYVVNWENDGKEMKEFTASLPQGMNVRLKSRDYYFKECYSWSKISSSQISFRYYPSGFAFDVAGCCVFEFGKYLEYFLGLSNSKITKVFAAILSPTLNYELDHLKKIPVIINDNVNIYSIVKENINLSKQDWDSFETSWDFKKHPLLPKLTLDSECVFMEDGKLASISIDSIKISEEYDRWKAECEDRFNKLKANEEELNRIFIDIYGLQDELTPEVDEKDVTVYRVFDNKEDIPEGMGKSKYALTKEDVIKSFVSYAVGCMFGRYSLDEEGLAYAGGDWEPSKYKTFVPDEDNIIPICDDEYFSDDIVGRFVEFVKVIYGEETLEENLQFIAEALGGKGMPKEVIRNYFLNDFYKDHCKTYQKRPIYWMFDSGKKNGFKALMYLHRYKSDTVARLRTKYVFDQQTRYDDQVSILNNHLQDSASQREKTRLNKELKKLSAQAEELRTYEETVHHFADQMVEIDLDDGVKVNYEKFDGLLAKIK